MKVYMVRHGETESNVLKKYCGSYEGELTTLGEVQAQELTRKLQGISFYKVYSSPLNRCRRTADIITGHNSKIIDDRLKERDFGIFENKTYEELLKEYPREVESWSKDWINYPIPKGESAKEAYDRVKLFMEELQSIESDINNEDNQDANILVVTHGGVIRLMCSAVLGGDLESFWRISAKPGSLTLFALNKGFWTLEALNI